MSDIVERLRAMEPFQSDDWKIAREAADEIERLRERLEMTHAWQMIDGKMKRVAVELGSIPDGIDCRDETIKLLKAEIERIQERLR